MGKPRRTAVTIEFASKKEADQFIKYASANEEGKLKFHTITPASDNPFSFGGAEGDDYTTHVAEFGEMKGM